MYGLWVLVNLVLKICAGKVLEMAVMRGVYPY
jgi:hypothetical protein